MNTNIIILLNNAGKKFGREWVFRNVTLEIKPQDKLVILGLNGSGKSTLLQALTGYLTLNEGELKFDITNTQTKQNPNASDFYYKQISLASPYLELLEDFTLKEMIAHTQVYKPFINNLSVNEIVELSGLSAHQHKYIKLFSSGMKQRLKLTLAILADVPILLLDEPTTNLDATVVKWYQELIETYTKNKTVIVCSNSIKDEYAFCTKTIVMEDFKNKKIAK